MPPLVFPLRLGLLHYGFLPGSSAAAFAWSMEIAYDTASHTYRVILDLETGVGSPSAFNVHEVRKIVSDGYDLNEAFTRILQQLRKSGKSVSSDVVESLTSSMALAKQSLPRPVVKEK